MESGDDYIIQLISMLPSYLQSRLPIVPLRLRSFGSLQSSIAGTACGSSSQTRATTLSRNFNNINGNAECSSYSELTEASSSSGSFTSTRRRSITTSLSSILANDDDDQDHPGNAMAEQGPIDEIHYEQFVRHFLRSVREVDTRRQLDSRRLLEGSQTQPGDLQVRPPRLPRHFNGRSHDTVDQRWSPSGIKWRYARQGAQLATDASNEMEDPGFERSAYIDAVAYYLRALPQELDEGENAKLLAAAPWMTLPQSAPRIAITRPTDRGRTFLADTVQYAVIGLVLLAHMLWCFLLSALRIGAYLEREYNLSQWLVENGYDLANAVGRHSVTWTAKIVGMNEGRFGRVVSWTMDSVTGGIQEGYGMGMERIRQRNTQAREAERIVDLRRSRSRGR